MGLKLHGEAGAIATTHTQPSLFLQGMEKYEKTFVTFDIIAFGRYHHGGKVQTPVNEHLHDSVLHGEKEVKSMQALKALIQRVMLYRSDSASISAS
jgi:hypothetical protein